MTRLDLQSSRDGHCIEYQDSENNMLSINSDFISLSGLFFFFFFFFRSRSRSAEVIAW